MTATLRPALGRARGDPDAKGYLGETERSPLVTFSRPLASAILCLSLLTANTHAAGMTAHALAGARVVSQLKSRDLARILRTYPDDFFNGVAWPDAILARMKADDKSDSDQTSHGRITTLEDRAGWTVHYLDWFRARCPNPTATSACRRRVAFFMGALTHLVVDGPWHKQYIDHTTASCGGVLKGTSEADLRHPIADTNVDYCLERRLRGLKSDIRATAFLPATDHGKAATCKKGEDLDPRKGGECWKCPKGYIRTLESVTTWSTRNKDGADATPNPNGCQRALIHTRPATYKRKVGCPGKLRIGGKCWTCPKGFRRTGEAIDSPRACQKATRLPCSQQEVPEGATRPALGSSVSSTVYEALERAYARDGKAYINEAYARAALDAFRRNYGLEGLAAGAQGVVPYGDECPSIYEDAVTGKGGLDDGRDEAVALIDALWTLMKSRARADVIRTSTYRYQVGVRGTSRYETRDRIR